MKFSVFAILLFFFSMIYPTYAQYIGNSTEDAANLMWPPICTAGPGMTCPPVESLLNNAISIPFEESDTVVVGKIIDAKSLPEQNQTQYNIGIEYYLKNEKPHDLLNVIGDGMLPKEFPGREVLLFNRPIFEKDDRVFLYLTSKEGKYYLSPYSFALNKNIPSGPPPEYVMFMNFKNRYYSDENIIIAGMVQKGNLYLSVAEYHAKPEVIIRFDNTTNQPFFEDVLDVKADGTFSYETKFSAKNTKTGSYSFGVDTGWSSQGSSFEYIAYPLKQFKEGIPIEKIQCKENLITILKKNGKPACVTQITGEKLIERGWATFDISG